MRPGHTPPSPAPGPRASGPRRAGSPARGSSPRVRPDRRRPPSGGCARPAPTGSDPGRPAPQPGGSRPSRQLVALSLRQAQRRRPIAGMGRRLGFRSQPCGRFGEQPSDHERQADARDTQGRQDPPPAPSADRTTAPGRDTAGFGAAGPGLGNGIGLRDVGASVDRRDGWRVAGESPFPH